MKIQEFEVLRTEKGLGSEKDRFVISYNGNEYKVPLFNFQKDRPQPDKIKCVINSKEHIWQDWHVLIDEFYKTSITYIFKVKNKRIEKGYYELEQEMIKDDGITIFTLPFSDSRDDLEVGQVIECLYKGFDFDDERPKLFLFDADPSHIVFQEKREIFCFDENDGFAGWLDSVFKEDFMSDVAESYEAGEGSWLLDFSEEIEQIVISLLLSSEERKVEFLSMLCDGWINKIEHSPFMMEMTNTEKKKYKSSLARSIEICEDYRDVMAVSNKEEMVSKIIESLDSDYYQYRIERKFRYLLYIFTSSPEMQGGCMGVLLDKIGRLGEDECCGDKIYLLVEAILQMCVQRSSGKWANCMFVSDEARNDIKNGILALCFLIKIKCRLGEPNVCVYVGKLYVLLSFFVNDKMALLENAYNSLFADKQQLINLEWGRLGDIVKSDLYTLCIADIKSDGQKVFYYGNGTSVCLFGHNGIYLFPLNYNNRDKMSEFKLSDNLSVYVSYGKSLSRLDDEKDFREIRDSWNEARIAVSTPVKTAVRRNMPLDNGEEVDVYVTKIIDEETALCKVVGHDEDYKISFRDLLFYRRPGLRLDDFNGSDGSSLLFKGVCIIDGDGRIAFNFEGYKTGFVRDKLSYGDEVRCVVTNGNDGTYSCVTDNGLFIYVKTEDELEIKSYVSAIITDVSQRGKVSAEFECDVDDKLPPTQREMYAEYLKLLNEFCYGEEMTLYKKEPSFANKACNTSEVGKDFILTVADLVSKMSETERNPRRRYGYLAVCEMMAKLVGIEKSERAYEMRMKYAEILYDFSLNNNLSARNVEDFMDFIIKLPENEGTNELKNIVTILSKYKRINVVKDLDDELIKYFKTSASPIERNLARLVLSGNLLPNGAFQMQGNVLDEIGKTINVDIIKPERFKIDGDESDVLEFKTSLVYPPNNGGRVNAEEQSGNILRVILAMMNAKGGVLYIGVNDEGVVTGLHNDLEYFGYGQQCNEKTAMDRFMNYFSCKLNSRIGAENAWRVNSAFESFGDYRVFKVEIPVIHIEGNDLYRVGNTVQKGQPRKSK